MTQVAKIDERRPAVTPAEMLQIAIDKGADLDRLEKLMALQERWETQQAKKAYIQAMACFKANPPEIIKNKHVDFATQKGRTTYNHATHDEVCNKITKALSEVGITHAWQVEQQETGLIKVTCTLTHIDGHSESASLFSGRDDSGGKNNIQAIGSAVTYLQRYTLLAVTGLTTREADDDGGATEKNFISVEQCRILDRMINEVGANVKNFLAYMQVEQLGQITTDKFDAAVAALEKKRGK